jgi:hypothetical protein
VNSTDGELYRIDATTLEVTTIDLGAESLNGDGILLAGRTLYVVLNSGSVAVVDLSADLSSGAVVAQLSGDLAVPTTVARFGSSLFVVNARFDVPVTADTEYWITRLDRLSG